MVAGTFQHPEALCVMGKVGGVGGCSGSDGISRPSVYASFVTTQSELIPNSEVESST